MRHLESDSPQVRRTIQIVSAILWVPYFVPVLYTVSQSTFTTQLTVGAFSLAVVLCTWLTAKFSSGDVLMVACALIGFFSEMLVIGEPGEGHESVKVSKNIWFISSAVHGLFAGILCKAKDIQDERFYETYTVTERLYLVIPYTVGIWTAYVWMKGIAGFVAVFKSIFFALSLCGYGVLGHRVLQWSGVYGMDLIGLVNHLFTTSFGVVFSSLAGVALVAIYLAAPFVSSLLQLNAVVSALGILIEIVIYDLA